MLRLHTWMALGLTLALAGAASAQQSSLGSSRVLRSAPVERAAEIVPAAKAAAGGRSRAELAESPQGRTPAASDPRATDPRATIDRLRQRIEAERTETSQDNSQRATQPARTRAARPNVAAQLDALGTKAPYAVSRSGRFAVATERDQRGGGLVLCDLANGRRLRGLDKSQRDYALVDISPDARWIAAIERDRDDLITLWRADNGLQVAVIDVGGGAKEKLAFAPRGNELHVTADDGEGKIYSIPEGHLVGTFGQRGTTAETQPPATGFAPGIGAAPRAAVRAPERSVASPAPRATIEETAPRAAAPSAPANDVPSIGAMSPAAQQAQQFNARQQMSDSAHERFLESVAPEPAAAAPAKPPTIAAEPKSAAPDEPGQAAAAEPKSAAPTVTAAPQVSSVPLVAPAPTITAPAPTIAAPTPTIAAPQMAAPSAPRSMTYKPPTAAAPAPAAAAPSAPLIREEEAFGGPSSPFDAVQGTIDSGGGAAAAAAPETAAPEAFEPPAAEPTAAEPAAAAPAEDWPETSETSKAFSAAAAPEAPEAAASLAEPKDDEVSSVVVNYATNRKRLAEKDRQWLVYFTSFFTSLPAFVIYALVLLAVLVFPWLGKRSWAALAVGTGAIVLCSMGALEAYVRSQLRDELSGELYGAGVAEVSYGRCEVSVPPANNRQAGEVNRPVSVWVFEAPENAQKHFILRKVTEHPDEEAFFASLGAQLEKSPARAALLFIHGYNVSFEDAVFRTAQLAVDLKFPGAPILYSWPSCADPVKYTFDEQNAEVSIPAFRKFLEDLAARSGAERIHIIAHSMGNRVLAGAMEQMSPAARERNREVIREVVLAAPDIDSRVFKSQVLPHIVENSQHCTLYASSRDRALLISRYFHNFQRLGETEPELIVADGMDTIDASLVDTSLLGHSYIGDVQSIVSDVHRLVVEGQAAAQRGLESLSLGELMYWSIQPRMETAADPPPRH